MALLLLLSPYRDIYQISHTVAPRFILEWDIRIPSAFQPNHSNRMKTTLNLFDLGLRFIYMLPGNLVTKQTKPHQQHATI